MSLVRLYTELSQGTVASQSRVNSGGSRSAQDRKSRAPGALLTLQAVAERCDVSVWTVRHWVDIGQLEVVRLPGRLVGVRPEFLDAFLARCSG